VKLCETRDRVARTGGLWTVVPFVEIVNGMGVVTGETPLDTLWSQQSVWSQAADAIKRRIGRARLSRLCLAIAGAALGTASVQVIEWQRGLASLLAALAAVALALIPILGAAARTDTVRDWTQVRSVAETLKAEMYTYLAGVAPYRGPHRTGLLLDRTRELFDGAGDLARYTVGIDARPRSLPAVHDVAGYVTVRVDGQIDRYYTRRAREIHRTLTVLSRVQVGLAAVAAALAAVTSFVPAVRLSAWAGVITTVAAAVATHVAAERFEYQEVAFTRTAEQLRSLRLRFAEGPHDEEAQDAFVEDCERDIAVQNDAWMIRLGSGSAVDR
jgi:hypothetical protein